MRIQFARLRCAARPTRPARRAALGSAAPLLAGYAAIDFVTLESDAEGRWRGLGAADRSERRHPRGAYVAPRDRTGVADAIIEHRAAADRQPAFRVARDLDDVKRIGPRTIERLRPLLFFPAADGVIRIRLATHR